MRKSLREIGEIDKYLAGGMPAGTKLLFQARMLLSPGLAERVDRQQELLRMIIQIGRADRRRALNDLYSELMRHPDFRERVAAIFARQGPGAPSV